MIEIWGRDCLLDTLAWLLRHNQQKWAKFRMRIGIAEQMAGTKRPLAPLVEK